jgi:ABC-2 type transport system ATP-binding protein
VIIDRGKLVADDSMDKLLHQPANNEVLKVSFREALDAAWLEKLDNVRAVKKISTYEWELICANAQDAQRQLMELALQQKLNIVSLQAGSQSLEEVFRSLTNNNNKDGNLGTQKL